ncbi:Hormone-sensitive lipase [Triplophysa tibetana]|uniref:Hormone-sensitive lipase n=1 Tax=Triplophysa tibetana TaxID=1572043 RepID=A0A5A9NPR3_9TELE|nr:Hormone-sensitive lipase [Triplophysa tibetana]
MKDSHVWNCMRVPSEMDHKDAFAALQAVCSEVIIALNGSPNSSHGDHADRILGVMRRIQEHGRSVEPLITGFTSVYHHFDLDAETPGNGYRTLVKGLCRIASIVVQVNLTITVPGEAFSLPLASDPSLSVSVSPPVAHWGPGPVNMRLISHTLRKGQDSAELMAFSRPEGPKISLPIAFNRQTSALSPCLLIHFHGGGFVAQTSKSHENYLKSWSKDLNAPVLSVDYSLAPEAPFPRALEECFYAYCWALKNCHLLGSTAERVCFAGDSAGGNLCITVSMRALSQGVRVPDGIVAAYPATLLTTDASPSRLLTLIDPLLPLSVLYKCIDAYAEQKEPSLPSSTTSSNGISTSAPRTEDSPQESREYPENFEPIRSRCLVDLQTPCTPIMKNPFVSPLLAPDNLLKGLPPVHLVASALDALLDDSVMFAKKLRNMNQPVTLSVVEDLPHGFLSLVQVSKETQEASDICVKRIREVLQQEEPSPAHRQPGLN